ncbi:MAG: hypothetical protein KF760_13990 [Candidatus Eremiobacteraeota bacterium]|nr:hypothetical protein [Candidatus Eremiobacteraeota bacterium]MCW5868976.1 hypothetical protein [Candidatus Eremiobacteraeota bacterium]
MPSSELAPRLNLKAPSHLLHILEDFDEGVRLDAPNTALRAMRQAFALLLNLSADILGAACVQLGASADLYTLEKGQSVKLTDSENRVKEALYFLSQNDSGELGKECAGIFFDASGTPRQFYLLTQGGRVEGIMGGLYRISDFCKEPTRAPGRSESFKLRNAYLPHLEAWIQAINGFFEKCDLLWERTDLEKQQRLLYRIYETELEVGQRIELHDCKACIPSRVLNTPMKWVKGEGFLGIPQEVPEHVLHLVDRYAAALEGEDIIDSTRLLRDTLEFLLRYFAGVGKMLCKELACLSDNAERFARNSEEVDNCERLLQDCVESLKSHQDDIAAKDFVGVFYRRDAHLELQPRSHTNILLLEGVLSSWFKQERGQTPSAERYAKDYERFFPLFRDWVRSMGPYFSHAEHFAEAPSSQGFLPLTVRCGEHLLELVEPDYLLRIRQCPVCLPNPIWVQQAAAEASVKAKPAAPSLSAEQLLRRANTKMVEPEKAPELLEAPIAELGIPKTYPGEFRPIDIPSDSPKFLGRVLRRLDVRLRRGELSHSRDALRDALDYLLRYWAGASFVCARDSARLSIDEEERAARGMGIQECEKLLYFCLQKLSESPNELGEEIVQVFYERDLFTDQLKPVGSHTRILITDADSDTQMQLLAEFCEMTDPCDLHRSRRDLKTFLPVLRDWLTRSQAFFEQCQHHEEDADAKGRMELVIQWDKTYLELVAPDFAFYVLPGSDLVPDLEVPEWNEPEAAKEEATVSKPKVITTEELALSEPFLIHKVQYVGIQPNSQGVACKSGIISIQNAGGGSLTGRAYSNHPCIEVNPNRFREKSQLQYWLNETAIPKDFVPVLWLRSGGDERQITLAELRPLSKFNTMPKAQALVITYGPAIIGFLITDLVIILKAKSIRDVVGGALALGELPAEIVSLAQTHGAYIGGLFLLYAAISPVVTMIVYRKFSHSLQDLLTKHFHRALVSPAIFVVIMAALNSLVFPVLRIEKITSANLFHLTPWALAFVVGSAIYCNLEYERKFAEWIQEPALRKIVPLSLIALFFILWTLALS